MTANRRFYVALAVIPAFWGLIAWLDEPTTALIAWAAGAGGMLIGWTLGQKERR